MGTQGRVEPGTAGLGTRSEAEEILDAARRIRAEARRVADVRHDLDRATREAGVGGASVGALRAQRRPPATGAVPSRRKPWSSSRIGCGSPPVSSGPGPG